MPYDLTYSPQEEDYSPRGRAWKWLAGGAVGACLWGVPFYTWQALNSLQPDFQSTANTLSAANDGQKAPLLLAHEELTPVALDTTAPMTFTDEASPPPPRHHARHGRQAKARAHHETSPVIPVGAMIAATIRWSFPARVIGRASRARSAWRRPILHARSRWAAKARQ